MLNRMPIRRAAARRSRTSQNSLPKPNFYSGGNDSCGCAMGAKFLVAGLILAIIWYVWRGPGSGLAIGGITARVLLWSFLAACVGKTFGIARYSLRRG